LGQNPKKCTVRVRLDATLVKKIWISQAVKKKQYFHCNGQRNNIKTVANLFQRIKSHCNAKTPPIQGNNTTVMAHKTKNPPFFPQLCTTFCTTHEHIFYITVFGISYRFHISQNFEQHFLESRDFVQNSKHAFYPQTASEVDRSRVTS